MGEHKRKKKVVMFTDSIDPMDEAYSTRLKDIAAEIKAGENPVGAFLVTILHDDECPKLKNNSNVCRCNPETKYERVPPTKK